VPEIETIAVIGAGTMGRGIAYAAAYGGYNTVLEDVSRHVLENAVGWIRQSFDEGVARGKVEAGVRDKALSLITTAGNVEDGIRELLDAPLDDGFREERLLRQPLEISRRYSVGRILTPDFHGHVSAEFGIVDRAHEVVEWREPDLLVFRAGFMVESEKFLPCASLLPIR